MKLALSAAAETRQFSRKFQRGRTKFASLIEQFSQVEMINPVHEAILVGLTDSFPSGYFEKVRNTDGFYQVLAGIDGTIEQVYVEREIFSVIERAVQECPFSKPDRETFQALLRKWREANQLP